jgi:hypothetical protein
MAVVEIVRRKAAIAGSVTDAITGLAIPGAVVKITTKNLEREAGPDGFFYFPDLRAGTYTLTVSAPLLGSRYGVTKVTGVTVQNAADGRPIFNIKANVRLLPTRVTGTVTRSSDGQPLPKAIVRVLGCETKCQTDQNGKYVLTGLYAGAPTVQASAAGRTTAAKKVALAVGQETVNDFSLA